MMMESDWLVSARYFAHHRQVLAARVKAEAAAAAERTKELRPINQRCAKLNDLWLVARGEKAESLGGPLSPQCACEQSERKREKARRVRLPLPVV